MSTTDLLHQQPSTINQQPNNDSEVLVRVENVSKKFCRSLKKSLWYGVQDIAHELNPFSRNPNQQPTTNNQQPSTSSLRPDEFWAVNDVSFELRRGECLGLIGHNGAGKTTLLKMLNGLIKPDTGRIEMQGRVGALIALGAGFNPILTGRENVYVNASVLGLTKREIDEKLEEIIDFAEIGEFIDAPVQSYSSGMQVRLGFSIATTITPDVLILDEILAVGDRSFRDQCYERIGRLLKNSAVIFVSHDESSVRRLADSCVLLKSGHCAFRGAPGDTFRHYHQLSPRRIHLQEDFKSSKVRAVEASIDSISKRYCGNVAMQDIIFTLSHAGTIATTENVSCYINILNQSGEVVIQSTVPISQLALKCSISRLSLKIEGLSLASGTYTISFICFGGNGKDILFSLRNFACFTEESNTTLGPLVTAPTKLIAMEQAC